MTQWLVCSSTHPGTFHKKQNVPCEDYAASLEVGEYVLAVLADGSSTAAQGGRGAELTVSESMGFLSSYLKALHNPSLEQVDMMFIETLTRVRKRLLTEANEKNQPFKEFAATLLIVLVHPQGLSAFHIGDGFIVLGNGPNLTLCSLGILGEYVNETEFLTDPNLTPRFIHERGPFDFFALSTDGLVRVAIDSQQKKPHPGFFAPFQAYLKESPTPSDLQRELNMFLASDPLHKRVKDDLGLVIGGRRG